MISAIQFYPWPLCIGLCVTAVTAFRLRGRGLRCVLGAALLGLYLMALAWQMFFPILYHADWPANLTWGDTLDSLSRINLIPFYYGTMFTNPLSLRGILWEIAGNLLVTLPFGFGMRFLAPLRGRRLLLLALATGLALEGTQLALKLVTGLFVHTVDINDVILNGLGVLIGAGAYALGETLLAKVLRRLRGGLKDVS